MKKESKMMARTTTLHLNLRLLMSLFLGLVLSYSMVAQSYQEENKKLNRQTNKLLLDADKSMGNNDFASAEASYRKAVSKNPDNLTARYNMANMYYTAEKPAQAASRLKQAAKLAETKEEKHKIFHNLGNSFMGQKKYGEAVEAYKNALRNNPKDEETRYNLALAKKMLEEEEPEGGGGEDDQEDEDQQDQDQDQDDGGEGDENEDQDEQEGQDQESDGEGENESEQDESENGDQGQQQEQEGQPQQPQPGQLSPEQIKSLLEAMNNEEKKVQDKINAERSKGAKTRTEKDW